MQPSSKRSGTEIAVIGMSGRFPGAGSVEELWEVLRKGEEKVARITSEEWAAEIGVHPSFLDRPELVKARPRLDGVELFDAAFFGYTPREAEILDPQQRLFLECCWEALENAGYDSERFAGSTAVAAGVSQSSYLMQFLQFDRELTESMGPLKIGLANMNDSLATRVAYKLNLRGAAFAVQSFCSTSLVAVHLAVQNLLNRESDMALAGGATIAFSQNTGYLYQEGGILSPDGHTRTFDAKGQGMVFGNGLGVVVLRRLEDALRDGDNVRAVILGTAINNDGSMKVGFTAPSVTGQAEVIVEALSAAGVNPETISYVEAHGTATALGDPAEIAGLTKAWRKWTERKRFCAIGSVKTNIGHLDAAAGVAGLIKVVLSLEHGQVPKSLHFETPNPQIDFENSPFFVASELMEWKSEGPRRAGLSSFGIGGTNAHAIVEEAPVLAPTDAARPDQLLVLSAKTASSLDQATRNLAAHLASHPRLNLADTALTLQVGRRVFNHRRIVVARDVEDARAALEDPARLESAAQDRQGAPVALLFTGQGSQYVGMGAGLYEGEKLFREAVDACCHHLREPLGLDLREVLFAPESAAAEAAEQLRQTYLTQPALFAVEYALARLWMSWGLEPVAMVGHSVGEYVAAHLAGVFSLEDALTLVAERGRLMQSVPPGAMLAVPLGEAAVKGFLSPDLDLATVNAPAACVVAGPTEAVDRFERELAGRGITGRRLQTSHAFHSAMMDPILPAFRECVLRAKREAPRIPFVSNLTGRWITEAEATDADYWVHHLRRAVRFSDGVATLLGSEARPVLLEVGPGGTLASLVRLHATAEGAPVAIHSLRSPREARSDRSVLLGALGKLWLAGVKVDWERAHAGERRRRVALPTYPFERQRHFVGPNREHQEKQALIKGFSMKRRELQDWFYQPSWRRFLPAQVLVPVALPPGASSWVVFLDDTGFGDVLVRELRASAQTVATVRAGRGFRAAGPGEYEIDPRQRAEYVRLMEAVGRESRPHAVLHLWGLTADGAKPDLEETLDRGFYSLLFLAQALARAQSSQSLLVAAVTNHMQDVLGGELTCPEKATVLGPCKVIPQELANVFCRSIDIELPEAGSPEETALGRRLLADVGSGQPDQVVAYRGPHRWVQSLEPMPLASPNGAVPLRDQGVYLVTGGLGGIGLAVARHLAERYRARLVLTGRSPLPPREEWDSRLEGTDGSAQRIREVLDLEGRGGEVLYLAADVTVRDDMARVVVEARRRFGPIQGVIHSAGVPGGGIIPLKEREAAAHVMAPKVQGTLVLEAVLKDEPLDFLVLCSSVAAVVGGFGQVDYCAANAFLDAYAHRARRATDPPTLSLNWDAWREVGMAVNTAVPGPLQASRDISLKVGISSAEGVEALERVLAAGLPQVAIFTMDVRPGLLQAHLRSAATPPAPAREEASPSRAEGPASASSENDIERLIIDCWERILGRSGVGANDNFFELGGDSLTALQVVALLKARLGRDVPIVTFYEAPTVGLLARALGDGREAPAKAAALDDVEQRADSRLDMLNRRRQQRGGIAVSDPSGVQA